jgi:hypothetical protein
MRMVQQWLVSPSLCWMNGKKFAARPRPPARALCRSKLALVTLLPGLCI